MKKVVLFSVLALLLTSCGVNSAMVLNHNQNSTQVQLGESNYKVVDRVSGSSSVNYILMFGGMNKRQLYANAYADLVKSANLSGGSRALVNIVTEEHLGGVPPFYTQRTITVSAHVIEFTR